MVGDGVMTARMQSRKTNRGRVGLRFFDDKLKRLGRFTSYSVDLWGRSVPSGSTIFSWMRAPVRPLSRAEVRRDIAQRLPRYPPRSLRRSATAEEIDAQLRGLRDDCTGNVPDEFRVHTTKHSNSPSFRRAPNLAPKPRLKKRMVNWLTD